MTTIKIDIPDQQAEALKAKAAAQGLTLEDWFRRVAEQEVQSESVPTDPQEWIRQFNSFVESLDPNTPVLSDEAMSRESIYPDRT
jgi:hypothetical protein